MRRPELTNLSISVALAATDHQNTMEHVHEESIQSSPRLSSKYSEIPLDHRSRGEDGMRVHPRLNGTHITKISLAKTVTLKTKTNRETKQPIITRAVLITMTIVVIVTMIMMMIMMS